MKTLAFKRLGKREKLFLMAWAAVLAVAAVKTAGDRVAAAFRELDAGIAAAELKLAKLSQLRAQADSINTRYDAAVRHNKSARESGPLIEKIENIARKADVNLVNLKPMQLKEAGQQIDALKVELQDDFHAIMVFFDLVNKELGAIGVDRLQISAQNREEPPHAVFIFTEAGEAHE